MEDDDEDDDDEKASSSADQGEYATKIFDAKTGALTSLPNSEEPLVVVENGASKVTGPGGTDPKRFVVVLALASHGWCDNE